MCHVGGNVARVFTAFELPHKNYYYGIFHTVVM